MTRRGSYRILGGAVFERDLLEAAAPADLALDAGAGTVIALLPFPADDASSQGAALGELLADLNYRPPSALWLVLTGLDAFNGFRVAFEPLTPAQRQSAFGVEHVADPAETLTALLADVLGERAATEADLRRRVTLLTLGAAVHSARPAIAEAVGRLEAVAPVRGVYVATFRSEGATFSQLLGDNAPPDSNFFVEGLFSRLPRAPSPPAGGAGRRLLWLGLAIVPVLAAAMLPLAEVRFWNRIGTAASEGDRAETAALLKEAGDPRAAALGLPQSPSARETPVRTAASVAPVPAIRFKPPPEFYGPLAQAYREVVLPACEAAVRDRHPFFVGSAQQSSIEAFRETFAPGGVMDQFLARLTPHIDRSGPVWRWKAGDSAVAGFAPETPELLARAVTLGQLAQSGATFSIELGRVTGGIDGVELQFGSRRVSLTPGAPPQTAFWRPGDGGESVLQLTRAGRSSYRVSRGGPWAPVEVVEQGRVSGGSADNLEVTFGDGLRTASLTITSEDGIFGRGGLWSFRCPAAL